MKGWLQVFFTRKHCVFYLSMQRPFIEFRQYLPTLFVGDIDICSYIYIYIIYVYVYVYIYIRVIVYRSGQLIPTWQLNAQQYIKRHNAVPKNRLIIPNEFTIIPTSFTMKRQRTKGRQKS